MPDKGIYKFPKECRLHHRSLVEGLFKSGKSFYEFPFRVSWRELSAQDLEKNFRNNVPDRIGKVQMMVTVPKKKRKRAVDRVQMRRRIRESYRLHRHSLEEKIGEKPGYGTFSIGIVYIHHQSLPYNIVEEKMKVVIDKLKSRVTL